MKPSLVLSTDVPMQITKRCPDHSVHRAAADVTLWCALGAVEVVFAQLYDVELF